MAEFEIVATAVLTYLGAGASKVAMVPWEEAAERFRARIRGVGEKAAHKKGGRPLDYNERVTFKALSEAAFNDDEIVSDYLGGVLAASGPDDDAGAAIVAQIGRLSATQLALHYLIYRELRRLWPSGETINLAYSSEARKAGVSLAAPDLLNVIGEGALHVGSDIAALVREGLLGDTWKWGERGKPLTEWKAEVRPSALGAELFLWGHGVRPPFSARLFEPHLDLRFVTEVPDTPQSALLTPPQPQDPE